MTGGLTITEVARRTGASARALRYWERLDLLPRAARSHTGHRLFSPDALRYVEFIGKSRSVGLSLAQMKRVLTLVRRGQDPCPEVCLWMCEKTQELERQIRALQRLRRRVMSVARSGSRRNCAQSDCCAKGRCFLVSNLPHSPKKGEIVHAQTDHARDGAVRRAGG